MKIHEYQGKEILRKFGVAVPRGKPAFSVDEAVKVAEELGGPVWVVKAQIHAGGRGKGGGVKVAKSIEQVREYANQILGMQLVTHQTGPEGQKVNRLMIEEGADIKQELYVSLVVDRVSQKIVLMGSSEGGMDIEEVAEKHPELIHKVIVEPSTGLLDAQADDLAAKIGVPAASIPQARAILQGLYKAFWETDASLAEINPLNVSGDGKVTALDAKFNFDSNALFRHPEIVAYRDLDEEDPAEIEASKFDLAYISLDGNPVMLREMLGNLIDNAIRYTPEGGRITVRVRAERAARRVHLEVEDTGPGIPAGERERVVERFYRILGREGDGSGLGLAIVREIATQHGGTLTLDDHVYQHAPRLAGTLVRISLPLTDTAPD